MTPREIMQEAGESQTRTTVKAGVSEPTLRLYDANPAAVTREKRRAKRARSRPLDSRAYLATVVAVVGVGNGAGGPDTRVQLVALALLAIFAVVAVLGTR
jgi:hypothetical protein